MIQVKSIENIYDTKINSSILFILKIDDIKNNRVFINFYYLIGVSKAAHAAHAPEYVEVRSVNLDVTLGFTKR